MKINVFVSLSILVLAITSGCVTRYDVDDREDVSGRSHRNRTITTNPFLLMDSGSSQGGISGARLTLGGSYGYADGYGGYSYGYVPSGMGGGYYGGYGMVQSDPRNQRQNWHETQEAYGLRNDHGHQGQTPNRGQGRQGSLSY